MSAEDQEQIAARLVQMPKQYRPMYKRAMTGKSRKAAMQAFCAECCGYQIKEVYLCTDLGCSLYPYRPCSRVSQGAPQSVREKPECEKVSRREQSDRAWLRKAK